jgi:DNA topoisomerase-1
MTASHLVVVESPAKAKTINQYLGKDYEVLASFGHVRDLPSKDGSVRPDEDFAMTYEVDSDSAKHVIAIAKAVKGVDTLYLATDPDREGEAISWHILEALKERKALSKNTVVKRIAFNAITKSAVTQAIQNPRDIDMDLVNAQQARRALDYLVGFTLSPILWRKLPGSKSAGRVQSVALRLVCDREAEIEKFITEEYWDISATLKKSNNVTLEARLTHYNGEKLQKFSFVNEQQAHAVTDALKNATLTVSEMEQKEVRRHPAPPFMTSTLQQEASRKLGMSAKQTMNTAQRLYEAGLITYMRTDGLSSSPEAIEEARRWIGKAHGKDYVPAGPRIYKTKAKNAQEAHEAIRPTEVSKIPAAAGLTGEQFKLYELIWKRMVASQMESAVMDQMTVDFTSASPTATMRAVGSVVKFDGFMTLYREDKDDKEEGDEEESSRLLPPLSKGEALAAAKINPAQHFTQPPPRFTEASLVKRLEELGIGRPSTYASIIAVLVDRGYVLLDKKRFTAEARGRIVNAFLVSFFERYVQYDFTAQIEEKLDEVSAGNVDWKVLLHDWWKDFSTSINQAKELPSPQVLESVDKLLESFLYGKQAEGHDPRHCPKCAEGRLSLKTGKFGAFLGCSGYPECNYTKPIASDGGNDEGMAELAAEGPKNMGNDPMTKLPIWLKKGPYGLYVQLGDDEKGTKPKRASLPKGQTAEGLTLERALELLALPRDVGNHPETSKMITAGLGRFGPYLLHDGKYTSIPAGDDVYTIGINRAVDVIASKALKRGAVEPLKNLGAHPAGGGDVQVFEGKYGAYVKHGKTNATLPKGTTPESLTMEEAVALIAAKAGSPAKGKKKTTPKAKAPAAKKAVAKKAPAKKPAAKKVSTKKKA